MAFTRIILFIMVFFASNVSLSSDNAKALNWQSFNAKSFEQAQKEDKYILLDLVAVWCHWCHVMDEKTYKDREVLKLINEHYIPVQADHDKRPDLAERYREWGWPATIILAPDGTEIVKRAGYINPQGMRNLLQAVIDDPSPEASTLSLPDQLSQTPTLPNHLIDKLKQRHINAYDTKLGGLAINQKFLDADSVNWDLYLASQGDEAAKQRIYQTLDAAAQLIDPEFGGAYQYSTYGSWKNPHFEKIMLTQHKYLTVYSKACIQFNEKRFCDAAKQVANYLLEFLYATEKGVFYTSQDADLTQGQKSQSYFALKREDRLKLGIPRIDKHHYASHNGRAIEGLVKLYQATKDDAYLSAALKAYEWMNKHRGYYGGGYRHDYQDEAGPYLADTLYMGKASLALYEALGEQQYLDKASAAVGFIAEQFKNPNGGLVSAVDNGTPAKPLPQLDQNIDAAQFLLSVYQQTQKAEHLALAEHTQKLLATEKIAMDRITEAGILLIMQQYQQLKPS